MSEPVIPTPINTRSNSDPTYKLPPLSSILPSPSNTRTTEAQSIMTTHPNSPTISTASQSSSPSPTSSPSLKHSVSMGNTNIGNSANTSVPSIKLPSIDTLTSSPDFVRRSNSTGSMTLPHIFPHPQHQYMPHHSLHPATHLLHHHSFPQDPLTPMPNKSVLPPIPSHIHNQHDQNEQGKIVPPSLGTFTNLSPNNSMIQEPVRKNLTPVDRKVEEPVKIEKEKSTSPSKKFAFISHSQATFLNQEPDIDNLRLARRKRRRTSPLELSILQREFEKGHTPNMQRRLEIAEMVDMSEKSIQIWFQNKRQTLRKNNNNLSREIVLDIPKRKDLDQQLLSSTDDDNDMDSSFNSSASPSHINNNNNNKNTQNVLDSSPSAYKTSHPMMSSPQAPSSASHLPPPTGSFMPTPMKTPSKVGNTSFSSNQHQITPVKQIGGSMTFKFRTNNGPLKSRSSSTPKKSSTNNSNTLSQASPKDDSNEANKKRKQTPTMKLSKQQPVSINKNEKPNISVFDSNSESSQPKLKKMKIFNDDDNKENINPASSNNSQQNKGKPFGLKVLSDKTNIQQKPELNKFKSMNPTMKTENNGALSQSNSNSDIEVVENLLRLRSGPTR